MEQETEKPINNGGEIVRDGNGRVVSGVLNPNGRPKGSRDFNTDFDEVVEEIAKENGKTKSEVRKLLLRVAYKEASMGDYNFFRDIHDRIYGRPIQKNETDLTTQGEKITSINVNLIDSTKK